jgi:predicted kinase
MIERKPCIIFDIDGTLADLTHRRHLVTGNKKNWPEFFARVGDDLPMEQTIWLNSLITLYSGLPVFLASGRSEKERVDTETWLTKYEVCYNHLYMRPANDFRKDTIIKEEILAQIRSEGYEPWLIFDDRECVTEMWRKNGLFVLQCDPNPAEVLSDSFEFHKSIEFPLTIMVGPSGAGKSTLIDARIESSDWQHDMVISSDSIRQQINGNITDQTKNEKVFALMKELAIHRLRSGLPVILDATHIRNADRIAAAKIVPESVPVQYVVINRPIAEKTKTGGWRTGVTVKGRPLIEAHDQTFKANLKDIRRGDNLPNVTVRMIGVE